MGNKIKHIQGYDLYNDYTAIVDKGDISKQRLSQQAKILKANFLMGPCRANGIIVNVEIPDLQNQTKQDDNKGADNKTATNKSTDNKTVSKSDTQQSQSINPSTGKPNEKYNYSIFESYMAYSNYVFNEDSDTNSQSDEDSDTNSQSDKDSDSDKGSNNKLDKKISKNATDDDNKDETGTAEFNPGSEIYVQVLLPNEGYSIWQLYADQQASNIQSLKAIQKLLIAKKFKQAYQFASKLSPSEGLVATRCASYLNTNIDLPFLGRCRYAINASNDDDVGENQSISFAIAPINCVTKKPGEDYVLLARYNVTGDFTNGKAGELSATLSKHFGDVAAGRKNLIPNERDLDDEYDDEAQEAIDKFLGNLFKTPGDDSMYKDFVEIRDYLHDQIERGNLEPKEGLEKTDKKEYAKTMVKIKKTLLRF